MIEVIEYCALILWGIYLFLLAKREICRKNKYSKEYKGDLIIRKPFHIIRIDTLFFLLVYWIYNNFADNRVMPYLYLIIIITNIVYVVYDLADNYKNVKFKLHDEYVYYSGVVVLIIIALLYMLIGKDLYNTCALTLLLNMFVPIYIWLFKVVKKK